MSHFQEPTMHISVTLRAAFACTATLLLISACSTAPTSSSTTPNNRSVPAQPSQAMLAAFSAVLSGQTQVPPVPKSLSTATGRVDAVLDRQSLLLRWKLSFKGLTGDPVAAHFHGPAAANARAGVAVDFRGPVTQPMEGRITLNSAQAADLLAGKWYADIHTLAFPGGEIRGQMILRE
jgi:CHRD domain